MFLLLNQDGDQLLEVSEIKYRKHFYKGHFIGFNLYGYDNFNEEYMIGTFDSEEEALDEIDYIDKDTNPIKQIRILD